MTAHRVEDLWRTARRSLGDRLDTLLESVELDPDAVGEVPRSVLGGSDDVEQRIGRAFTERQELLGWWSLPATVQLIRVQVPESAAWCDLVVRDDRGEPIWDEGFPVPDGWTTGPLFVVRRVP